MNTDGDTTTGGYGGNNVGDAGDDLNVSSDDDAYQATIVNKRYNSIYMSVTTFTFQSLKILGVLHVFCCYGLAWCVWRVYIVLGLICMWFC